MKPDWKDAPEWAEWLCRDHDGYWLWFEREPILARNHYWVASGRRTHASYDGVGNYSCKEPRP